MKLKLVGKSRQDIEQLLEKKDRSQLLDVIYSLATIEPHFSPGTLATRRGISKDTVIALCKAGKIPRVHTVGNRWSIPLSSIAAWDETTALSFSANGL